MNKFPASSTKLAVNSILLFTITGIIELTLHEGGHFVAALSLGQHATLFHNYVRYNDEATSLDQRIFFAAAGPVVSLLIGIVCHLWLRRNSMNPFCRLFLWYLATAGYAGFFGYLMIAPFFIYGDTGFVLAALGSPMVLTIIIAAAGFGMLYLVMRLLARHLVDLMPEMVATDIPERQRWIRALIIFPLLTGTPLVTLLNLPVPTFLSLLAPICTPFSLLYPYGNYIRDKQQFPAVNGAVLSEKIPIVLWMILAVVILMNRLLVYGLAM